MAMLSFERMSALRALTLGVYVVAFYLLTDFGRESAVMALALIAATSALSAFIVIRWREHEYWLNSVIAGVCVGTVFCGVMPFMLADDDRDPRVPDWALWLFVLCASETAFFLSALGAFGDKLANLPVAIALGFVVLAIQVTVLSIGFRCFKPKVAKTRWED